jgi:hypothetical protein
MDERKTMYREAIEWIAFNDDEAETDIEVIRQQQTVVLVADIFHMVPGVIAREVIRLRQGK